MSIKNVTVADVALLELLDGKTDAPADVLDKLRARGLVVLTAGKAELTPKGRLRGEALRPFAHDMRLMFAGAAAGRSGAPLHTDAAPTLYLGGGRAHVRS